MLSPLRTGTGRLSPGRRDGREDSPPRSPEQVRVACMLIALPICMSHACCVPNPFARCMHAVCLPRVHADCSPALPRADGRASDAFSHRELQATGSSKALAPAASAAPRCGRRLRRERFRQPRCPIWAAAATAGRHGDGHHRGRWCPWHLEPEIRARAIAVRTCPPQDLAVARRPGQPRA